MTPKQLIRVGHSPDPDDAFMFYALANDKIDTGRYRFAHELVDIETLNRRAFAGELELTAVSLHAYAYLADKYVLCPCGASMGDDYGPMVVAREPTTIDDAARQDDRRAGHADDGLPRAAAVPGQRLSSTSSCRSTRSSTSSTPGEYQGQPIDAGLIIHEGQLTYGDQGLQLIVDLGQWWMEETGLPLPLGANGIRKDLGPEAIREVNRLLKESIQYGLDHRGEALDYALQLRPRPRSQQGRQVRRHVRQRLDARLRPPRPRSRAHAPRPRPRRRRDSNAGRAGVCGVGRTHGDRELSP